MILSDFESCSDQTVQDRSVCVTVRILEDDDTVVGNKLNGEPRTPNPKRRTLNGEQQTP
jgi:hypothetical protein